MKFITLSGLFVNFCVIAHLVQVQGQALNCDFINSLDCSARDISTVCGSDGKDYANRCYLAKVQCRNSDLHLAMDHPCPKLTASTPSSTVVPSPLKSTAAAEICEFISTFDCPYIPDRRRVCGTDGHTYNNRCFLAEAYCADTRILMAHESSCQDPMISSPSPTVGDHIGACPFVEYYDCSLRPENITCGSNGIKYQNYCYLAKEQCRDPSLRVSELSQCNGHPVSTTNFDCSVKCNSDQYDPVCGTDGIWYINMCQFQQAACTNRNLALSPSGGCTK